jgi:hypothetical protein
MNLLSGGDYQTVSELATSPFAGGEVPLKSAKTGFQSEPQGGVWRMRSYGLGIRKNKPEAST